MKLENMSKQLLPLKHWQIIRTVYKKSTSASTVLL